MYNRIDHAMVITNKKVLFMIFGTGDDWKATDRQTDNHYTLKEFKKIFANNSIDILKEVFLSDDICINEDMYYEYEKIADNGCHLYKKDMDEILTALTNIYVRLYNECSKEEQSAVLSKFTTIMASLNIINCSLMMDESFDNLSTLKYIDMMPINDVAKNALYINSYKQIEKYCKDSITHVNPNRKFRPFTIQDIENSKKLDKKYIYLRDNNLLEEYANIYELPDKEQEK